MLLQQGCAARQTPLRTGHFPASANHRGKMLRDSVTNCHPAARGSLYPGRVGFVHDNTRAVAFAGARIFVTGAISPSMLQTLSVTLSLHIQIEVRIDDFRAPESPRPPVTLA